MASSLFLGGRFTDTNGTDEAAKQLALELHNKFRFDHGVPSLKLDLNLCQQAEAFAQTIANGKTPPPVDKAGPGRHIYKIETSAKSLHYNQVYTTDEAVREALSTWYGYEKEYNWRRPSSSPPLAKLFSQLVWKSCEKLGVAVVTRGGGRSVVVVTLYSPAGNNLPTDKSFMENVLRPQGGTTPYIRTR